MLARLDAARAGRAAPASAPMLDEMSKRAQERVLLAQVGREIQANLRHMEQVLDAFFRDHAKRADLSTLTKDSAADPRRAAMLGLDDAEPPARAVPAADRHATPTPRTPVSNDDLELLAESLSGLGFYIEAVEQQRPDRDRLIAPLLAQAPRRGARAVGGDRPNRSRTRSRSCAPRCRSSSPRCSARRPTPLRARS